MKNSARHKDRNYGVSLYSEVIHPSSPVIAFLLFLAASLSFAVWAAIGVAPTVAVTALELCLLLWFYFAATLHITVTKGWLLVGAAAIERAFIYNFNPLTKSELARAKGRDLDPGAFLALKFWVGTGISLSLRDPQDPTPYWLVSTRRSEELVQVLSRADH